MKIIIPIDVPKELVITQMIHTYDLRMKNALENLVDTYLSFLSNLKKEDDEDDI